MSEPKEIYAGATAIWTREAGDYPASDGWSLEYVLAGRNGRHVVNGGLITASGSTYTITVPMAETATWAGGEYGWRLFATKEGDRRHVQNGMLQVIPATKTATDTRSHARRMVDALEATLEGKASKDQSEINIGGKSLKRFSFAELSVELARWQRIVQQEEDAAKVAGGMTSRKVIRTRFLGL